MPPVVRDVRPEGVARRRRSIAEPRIQRELGTRTEDEQEQERWPFPSPSAPARGRGGRRVSRQLGGPRATHPGRVACPSRGRPQALRRGQRSSRAPHPGAQGGARGPRGRADAARQWARPGLTRAEGVKVDVERAPLTQGRAASTSAGHCVHSRAEHDVTRQPQLPTPFSVAGTGHGSAPHGRSGAQFTSSICEAGEGAGERRSAPGWGRPGRGCEEPFAGPSDLARPAAVCPPDS